MSYLSANSPDFRVLIKAWLDELGEVLVLFRYSYAAGSKSFEFFTNLDSLLTRIEQLLARTCVTVWGQTLLPLRGRVDQEFIAQCLKRIPEGEEWLLVELVQVSAGCVSWYPHDSGRSLQELDTELEHRPGYEVAVGTYPTFSEEGGKEISALVPNVDGTLTSGTY